MEEARVRITELADEPFEEPWQARAVALAVEAVDRLGLSWDDFRRHLVAEVAADRDRGYYAAWMAALEAMVVAAGVVDEDDLSRERRAAATYRTELEGRDVEVVPLAVDDGDVDRVLATLSSRGVEVPSALVGCRHLELHRSVGGGDVRVKAFGPDAVELLDVAVGPPIWEELAPG